MECSIDSPEGHQLAQKFNELSAALGGFVPRSPSLWLEIYGDREAHLLLAKEENKILGYIIVTLQCYSASRIATVSELCVWERGPEVAKILIDTAELYAKKMNAYAFVSWENNDNRINEVLCRSGFFSVGRSVFSVGVTSPEFFKIVLGQGQKTHISTSDECCKEITVDLSKRKFPSYSGKFVIKINSDGCVSVMERENSNPYALIHTDVVTFSEIILGIYNPVTAYLLGKISVKPFWKFLQVIRILKRLSKRVKWYLPLGDFF